MAVISISSVINDITQDNIDTRNTVVKKAESKEVNVILIVMQVLLLHPT